MYRKYRNYRQHRKYRKYRYYFSGIFWHHAGLFTNYASHCQGQCRGKQEQGRDKQGQTGTNRDILFLSLLVPVCPCLSMLVPVCPCLSLSILVCHCLSLSVTVCPCMSLHLPYLYAYPCR